jgi:hypothetical protein
MTPLTVSLFAIASLLAVSGFVIAEVIRLNIGPHWVKLALRWNLFPEWDKRRPLKPHFRLAWIVGGILYAINLANWLFQAFTGISIGSPARGMDFAAAMLIYPLMCAIMWPMLIKAAQVVSFKER